MRPVRSAVAVALVLVPALALAACGRGSGGRRTDDAGAADDAGVAAAIPVVVQPLGTASLDAFAWRAGAGKPAFDRALAAEKRGDLPAIEREATAALAADPAHLEAAWVAAVARARLGRHDAVVAALEIAAAGDWAKWGERSLELQALAAFRESPAGRGWVAAADAYRADLAAMVGEGVIVVGALGARAAELYTVARGRWIRLTRTGGAIAGALRAEGAPLVAYVAMRPAGRGPIPEVRIGVVELSTGRAAREVIVRDVRDLTLSWRTRAGAAHLEAAWTPATGRRQTAEIDWTHGRRVTIDKPRPPIGERLVVEAAGLTRRRLPLPGVVADWDEGAASAMRLEQTGKVVAAPGGGLIDGDTVVRAPGGSRLAFAIAPEPPCDGDVPGSLIVAEVATGRVRALAKGAVGAPHWLDDDRIAFVDGDAVTIAAAATGKAIATIAGGAGVATIAGGAARRCASVPAPFAGDPIDDPPTDGELADDERTDETAAPPDEAVENSSASGSPQKTAPLDGGSLESSE